MNFEITYDNVGAVNQQVECIHLVCASGAGKVREL